MASRNIIKVDSTTEDFEAILALPVGGVFKIGSPDDYETCIERLMEHVPQGETFEATPITPGTDLYTNYGPDHLIVTDTSLV